jgi:hypothetical protein
MKKIIEKYKKFIFIYVLVNLFALGINLVDLDFRSSSNRFDFYYLTNYERLSDNLDHFWPFVKFAEFHDTFNNWGNHNHDYTNFNGIFYHYDISEFIFYIVLLFAVLFYKSYIHEKKIVVPAQDAAKN